MSFWHSDNYTDGGCTGCDAGCSDCEPLDVEDVTDEIRTPTDAELLEEHRQKGDA